MIGASKLQAILGAAPPANAERDVLRAYLRSLCDAGLHVLFIMPGSKLPADLRTSTVISREDSKARKAAQEAGSPNWDKVKSPAGVHLATNNRATAYKYLDAYRERYGAGCSVNLAVALGPSGLVVVDCDTPEQTAAFLAAVELHPETPPTVLSPGATNAAGELVHHGGGHFWFTATDEHAELLGRGAGAITMPGDFAVMYRGRYVLIPPSVREGRTYYLAGDAAELPPRIVEWIAEHAAAREQRAARLIERSGAEGKLAENIDAWARATPWADLLEPAGWTLTGRPDSCGCAVWTAPGEHTSPKSGTAHEHLCSLAGTGGVGLLHVWTDNPGEALEALISERGTKHLTKLQVFAATQHAGDMSAAMSKAGVLPDLSWGGDIEREAGVSTSQAAELITTAGGVGDDDPDATPEEGSDDAGDDAGEPDDPTVLLGDDNTPTIRPFAMLRNIPPPEYIIDGLLEHRATTALVGPSGAGKSTVMLDMLCHIAAGIPWQGRRVIRCRTLYLPGEGLTGAVARVRAWEEAHGIDVGDDLLVGDNVLQLGAKGEAWGRVGQYAARQHVGLIVIDTLARASVGMEENSNKDMGLGIERFRQMRDFTGAGVLAVHHTGKDASKGARGASAFLAALDSSVQIEKANEPADLPESERLPGRGLLVTVPKQKNGPEIETPIELRMVPMFDSVVITGPTGTLGDPFLAAPAPVRVREAVIETAIRIREVLESFPQQGLTRGDLATGGHVRPDSWHTAIANHQRLWRRQINAAVDLALGLGLIDTLTGTPAGARYIPGQTDPDAARTAAAAANFAGTPQPDQFTTPTGDDAP